MRPPVAGPRARSPATAGNDRFVSSLGWGVAFVLGQLGSQPWDSAVTEPVPPFSPDAEPVCAALVLLVLLLALVCFWCRRRVPSAATARRVVSVAVKRVASWPRSRSNHMLAPLGARRSRISSDATLPGRESAFREQL